MRKNIKNEKGQISCYIPFFIMLILAIGYITATMQNDIRHGYCNLFGHDPVPDGEPSIRLLCSDGSDLFNFRERIEQETIDNGGDQGVADMIINILKEQITGGLESVPPGVVVYSSCWVTTDFMGQVWDGRFSIHDDCPSKGLVCEQVNENFAHCVNPAPNPTGIYYSCSEQSVCVETPCPEGQDCGELNEGGCNADNYSTLECGAAAGFHCTADCKGNAWEIACGESVLNNSQEEIDACEIAGTPLTCPGGIAGYACTDPNSYCDFEAGICEPIEFALCDENPSSAVTETNPLLSVTDDTVACGTTTSDGKWGTNCPEGKACDIIGEACFDPAISANTQKYEFDVRGGESEGIGINFIPISNTDFRYPQFCIPDNSIYCSSCGLNTDGGSQLLNGAVAITYDRIKSKAGSLYFSMIGRGISGMDNYALIQYNDVQKDDEDKKVFSERFVVQVDANQLGECAVESQEFAGKTGNLAKTFVKYTWDWDNIGKDFCESVSGVPGTEPVVCDGTQFMISLLERLNEMKNYFDEQDFVNAYLLADFNVLLMPDSFNSDFRNDFDDYYRNTALETPSWYKDINVNGFSKFVSGPKSNALVFTPMTITAPGKYKVRIDLLGDSFFDANGDPSIAITIGFSQLPTPQSLNINNALYYLPLDGMVGIDSSLNPDVPDRNGYGVSISGNQIALSGTLQSSEITGSVRATNVTEYTDFDNTNNIPNRGRLLQVRIKPNSDNEIIFSPVTATPVAMKVSGEETENVFGKYYLWSSASGNYENSYAPFAAWTGIASKITSTTEPPCSDFQGRPLSVWMEDSHKSGDQSGYRSLSFANESFEIEKFLVFSTVFYVPKSQALVLSHTNDNTVLITPDRKLIDNTSNADLHFTDTLPARPGQLPNGLKIDSLQDLVDLINLDVKAVCVYGIERDNGNIETVFFWNRTKIIEELLDKRNTPFSEDQTNQFDIPSGLGVSQEWFCG